MNGPWLILDCSQLIWASVHTLYNSGLSHKGYPTYAIYGFFNQVLRLKEKFNTDNIAFCFDGGGYSVRKKVFPDYKKKRQNREFTEEERIRHAEVIRQTVDLCEKFLPEMGFKNVFCQKGYEADDVIASIVKKYRKKKQLIIVSTDKDLYQLLGYQVTMYKSSQGREYTKHDFIREFGVKPKKWALIKAIAGCSTDEVPGIVGVGEATAAKFLRNQLEEKSKKYKSIKAGKKIIHRNMGLVKLPYKGTKFFHLRRDKAINWKPTFARLGIKALSWKGGPLAYKER